MAKKLLNEHLTVILLILMGLAAYNLIATAGSLEPSGPPSSTMKTLDQIDPGTPISSVPYTIAEPGVYYLCANAQTTNSMFDGISIYADNVTLDLKGFSLIGNKTPGRHGVVIEGDRKDITIRNGTITNWGGSGIRGDAASRCIAEDLRVVDNSSSGIYLVGDEQVVRNCVASGNRGLASTIVVGIGVGNGSVVTGNTASNNGKSATCYVRGIDVGSVSTITGNTVNDNGESATGDIAGIYAEFNCTVTGNTVNNNGHSAQSSKIYGIRADQSCTVSGNSVCRNGRSAKAFEVYGIHANIGCTVIGNAASYNGWGATGEVYGISLVGGCLVDQNTAYYTGQNAGSATSITLGVSGCVYGRNVAP